MNIQTVTLKSCLAQFRARKLASRDSAPAAGPFNRDYYDGFCEALRIVKEHMIKALENEMRDVVEAEETEAADAQELVAESEKRMADWLRNGAPEDGDEWKG